MLKRGPRPKPPSGAAAAPTAEVPAPNPKPGKTPRLRRGSEPATYNRGEAKTQLSELVDRASGGEEIVIATSRVPMARLTPLPAPEKLPPRTPGGWKEKYGSPMTATTRCRPTSSGPPPTRRSGPKSGRPCANRVAGMPRRRGDPCDRMLAAQARHEGFTLVTHDRAFAAYALPVLWA